MDWFRFTPSALVDTIAGNANANIPGSTNIIQATSNLETWRNVATNVADLHGLWQYTETNASAWPGRFYRSSTQ